MHYTSLTHLMEHLEFEDDEIWWITEFQGRIIFQSFGRTYVYDGERINVILQNKGVLFPPFVVNDRLFIQVLDSGIYEIKNSKPGQIPGSEIFIGKRINAILPRSNSSDIMIATAENGFYRYVENGFVPWTTTSDALLIQDQINRGIKIGSDLYAMGTILGGVYILNEQGEVLNQIERQSGLNNNTVLSLLLDKKGNLWVGMDNGIDLIKVNAPLFYQSDVSGEIGSVYSAAIHKGYLYLGTNRGVFYTSLKQQDNNDNTFSFIPGSQEQVWNLVVIDEKLFCGHNTATFIIEDFQLEKISDIAGGYDIKEYPFDDRYLIQGTYNGLAIFKKDNGKWHFSHIPPGFGKLSKIIEFERENVLWVSHTHRGLSRLELNDDLTEIIEIRSFAENAKTYVNKLNKKLVFSTDSGFVYYDDIQNSFFMLNDVNEALGDFAINSHIIPEGENYYWIFKDGDCARVAMDENSVQDIDENVLNDLSEYLIPGYENIYVVDSVYTIVYLDNGYAIHNNRWEDKYTNYKPATYIRSLSFHNLPGDNYKGDNLMEIPFRYNNIEVRYSYPKFTSESEIVYRLEGYDERWIQTVGNEEIVFQNLPYGDYTLHIKPEEASSDLLVSTSFLIKPPWFQSKTAYTLYLILSVVSLILFVVLNRRKIDRIHKKHEQERQQLLEQEAAENEKKLIKMRNENLRNELKLRNSRLAKSTFSLIHKNNTLRSVKEELTKIKEELGIRFPTKHYKLLIRSIDRDLTSEKDWRMFEQSFSEVHEHFLHRIKDEHPDLTPADIQLCAYLKMNLSSKEMASLLNITVRGVEIRRYRLRKKLNLDHDTNLTEYIMGY